MITDDQVNAHAPRPPTDEPEAKPPARRHYVRRTAITLLLVLVAVPVVLTLSGNMDLLAQSFLLRLTNSQPLISIEEVNPATPRVPADALTFESQLDHPDKLYRPYFGTPLDNLPPTMAASRLIPPFRQLLDLFIMRQGLDDNFTIRVYDKRTLETLEVFVLEEARQAYERTGRADWGSIDAQRRVAMRRLVDKYEQHRGIPREHIGARWGRKNQILEAREREAPTISYEMRLARYLDLSLLVTEIGTVETFNDDQLVSPVGARGRYQMMPYLLRQHDIHRYRLLTAYGRRVDVVEEWHPLLTMEPAFRTLRAYINAVGHEVPGISAYHSGPGNLYKVLQLFLTEQSDLLSDHTTVMDAYIWALTEGFERVSGKTSFRTYSQGYVPSGYGALRAVEALPIDTTQTLLAERVQLEPGREVYLSDLLTLLKVHAPMLYWGPHTSDEPLYARFRRMNPHFDLPFGKPEGGVPRDGDVRLVAEVDGAPVRFFLPLNAAAVLSRAGVDLFDDEATFRFDHDTYRVSPRQRKTDADRAYDDLVADIGRFGFTHANRQRLDALVDRFEQLAAENPSHFRQTQLDIIKTHRWIWDFGGWNSLAEATQAAKGSLRLPIRPPQQLSKVPARPPVPRAER